LSELFAAGADFLVVGAHALAARGVPRATGDLGIWIRQTQDNAERVLEALRRFGAPLHDLPVISRADFVADKRAAGRPMDLLDLALLDEAESGR